MTLVYLRLHNKSIMGNDVWNHWRTQVTMSIVIIVVIIVVIIIICQLWCVCTARSCAVCTCRRTFNVMLLACAPRVHIEYILVGSSTGPWDALHQCSTVQDILDISGYLWDVGLACVVLAAWAMHQKELVDDCIAHTWMLIRVHLKSGRELWVNLDFISVDLDWWLRVEGYSLFFLLECILCRCLLIDGLQDCGSSILSCIYVDRSMCMDHSGYILQCWIRAEGISLLDILNSS